MVTFFSTMPDPSDDTNYVSSFPGDASSTLLVQQSYHVGKKDETNNGGGDCSHDWSCSFKCCNCFNIRTKSTSSLRPECLHRFCNICSDNEDTIRLLKLDQCPACQKDLDETVSSSAITITSQGRASCECIFLTVYCFNYTVNCFLNILTDTIMIFPHDV